MTDVKQQLRKHFRKIREQIQLTYRKQAAEISASIFIQQDIFKQSEHIACYFSYRDEFDSMAIMEAIWQAGKHCYLPVLSYENTLYFVPYHKGDALSPNRYSIQEPVNDAEEFNVQDLDLVVSPLLAFDLQGHRLGTGGGYYDRTFAFLRKNLQRRPHIMGLGFAAQQAESLPVDEWDIGLDSVLTEREWVAFT